VSEVVSFFVALQERVDSLIFAVYVLAQEVPLVPSLLDCQFETLDIARHVGARRRLSVLAAELCRRLSLVVAESPSVVVSAAVVS
jgi:hypothetical protein